MEQPCFLGIDIGLTVIKANIYSLAGRKIGSGSFQGVNSFPQPHWVERDMDTVWEWVCYAIKQAIHTSNISSTNIKAIGVTAHGDGAFLVDKNLKPVRPAILSLDTRASDVLNDWESSGILKRAFQVSGQYAFVGSPAPILSWLKRNEPASYEKIRWILTCKDWIRFKLTEEIYTDFTESSNAFTNVTTQDYDLVMFELYRLEEIYGKIPSVKSPFEIAGKITKESSKITGLVEGTPVATGLHDMNACAIGAGCIYPGQLSVITGTWGINLVISDKPSINANWLCRNFIQRGLWAIASASPASATNLEWMVQNLCLEECKKADRENISKFDFANKEFLEVLDEETEIFFMPFLYGSPYGEKPSASFIGIRGWHRRAHLIKAIFEGVVFNHKVHVDMLKEGATISEIRLSGGGAKSPQWSQLFADMFNSPIMIPEVDEAGTFAASICGAIAVGYYSSVGEAVDKMIRINRVHEPNLLRHQRLENSFTKYCKIISALKPVWNEIG